MAVKPKRPVQTNRGPFSHKRKFYRFMNVGHRLSRSNDDQGRFNPVHQHEASRTRISFLLVGDSVPFGRFSALLHVSDTGRQASYEPEASVNSGVTFESKFMPLGLSDLGTCPLTAIPWCHRRGLGLSVPCQVNCAFADSMSASSSLEYCIHLFDACLFGNRHAVCGLEKCALNLHDRRSAQELSKMLRFSTQECFPSEPGFPGWNQVRSTAINPPQN